MINATTRADWRRPAEGQGNIGYTHYYTPNKNVDAATWSRFVGLAREVFAKTEARGIKICGPMGEGPPIAEGDRVSFNGTDEGDLGHESCVIERGGAWTFCKTAQKPYDIAVVALLSIGETLGVLTARSDGDAIEWQQGLELAREVLSATDLPRKVQGR